MSLRPLIAVSMRELRRTVRQRGRLFSALVRPLLWLMVIGGGVETMMPHVGSYRAFLAPGLVAMTLLFGAMLAALSLVHDRESGVLRMLLVAPIHHAWIVVARILSAALVALVQGLLLVVVLACTGYVGLDWNLPLLLAAVAMTALASACLGMLVAVIVRTLENFALMMNAVIFPVFFLSGALYPISGLPPYLYWAAVINPFSYGVDLLKHAGRMSATATHPDWPLAVDTAVLTAFILIATAGACVRFCQPGTLAAVLAPAAGVNRASPPPRAPAARG